jgi:DNA gyrase inhibitor GyrI
MHPAILIAGGLAGLAALGAGAWYWNATNVEQPDYTVVASEGDFEVRDYPELVVAEAVTDGDREAGVRAGFRALAAYIFAKDRAGEKIAMTSPVTQAPAVGTDEKISMTAPVTQAQGADGQWRVHFVMPSKYALEDLPAPGSDAVSLDTIPPRRVAAVRFSGSWSDRNMRAHAAELKAWMDARGLEAAGPATYAYYDDPFTPGFLRRNEVMIPVAQQPENPPQT